MADVSNLVDTATGLQPAAGDRARPGRLSRASWLSAFSGALVFALWALATGWLPPVTAPGVEQARLNEALSPPIPGQPLMQTFQPQYDGLTEVEILLARSTAGAAEGSLTMRLQDESGAEIASRAWPATRLQHNQPLTLRFTPQAGSAGQSYTLLLEGDGENPFGAWAYDLDVYEGGALQAASGDAAERAGDLRFATRYRLSPLSALQRVWEMLGDDAAILLLSLLLLPLPGCLVLLLAHRRLPPIDVGAWWSLALALGLAIWPLLWFWLTITGMHWTSVALVLTLVAGWTCAIVLYSRHHTSAPLHRYTFTSGHALLLLLLIAALAVRLLAIRDLAFPPWVDSSRHALITELMVDSGQTPDGYRPWLPVDDFTYHFGFHSLAASVQMVVNAPLPRTLLVLGQLLNALAALSVYGAAWLLTRRRDAALLAAFLVALPFFFPAYYITWGRFTQLTGALLLGPLLASTWLLGRGSRAWQRLWWIAGVMAAGLFLVHLRVFLVYALFAPLAWIASWSRGRRWRATRALAVAALLALVLVAPRLWQLAGATAGSGYLSSSGQSYAEFPSGYVTTGWERWFLLLGGLCFVFLALVALRHAAALHGARRKRRTRALCGVALGGWAGLTLLLLSGRVPGMPVLWLINLNSAYILLFIPLALLLALGFAGLGLAQPRSWLGRHAIARSLAVALLGAALAASALFGARQQVTILNETTILAQPADVEGLAWAAANLPPDARVAVNSWRWLGQTWAAGDGGAWLLPLAGLQPTTPPVDYIADRQLFQEVIAFNEAASEVEDWSSPEAAQLLAQQGVTHIFVGARGGFLDPASLVRNPKMRELYARDGVFVFEIGG